MWEPERYGLIGEAQEAFAGGLLDGMKPTGEAVTGICHSDGYIFSVPAAKGADSLLAEPCGSVPDAGVEEALFGVHGYGAAQSSAARELRKRCVGRSVEGEAETFGGGKLSTIDGDDTQVDLLAMLVAHDVGVRSEGLDLAQRRGADDGAFDGVCGFDAETAREGSGSGRGESDPLEGR